MFDKVRKFQDEKHLVAAARFFYTVVPGWVRSFLDGRLRRLRRSDPASYWLGSVEFTFRRGYLDRLTS